MIALLTPETDASITEIGGKAGGLVRLLAAGLDVPEAWVIPVSVSLDPTEQSGCLDTELPKWWDEVSTQFPGALWAVRSSAVAEDLEGASFAGVYETKLAIGSFDALRQAVTECWYAVTHDRATAYLDNREGLEAGGIALVLQRMIRPDAAGVMLTENPLKPFADEIVGENVTTPAGPRRPSCARDTRSPMARCAPAESPTTTMCSGSTPERMTWFHASTTSSRAAGKRCSGALR